MYINPQLPFQQICDLYETGVGYDSWTLFSYYGTLQKNLSTQPTPAHSFIFSKSSFRKREEQAAQPLTLATLSIQAQVISIIGKA